MIQMNLQNRKRLIDLENELLAARVEGGTDSGGVWEGHVHTALFKMENQRRPTRILLLCVSLDGTGFWGRMDTCIYIWLSPFTVHLKLPQYC